MNTNKWTLYRQIQRPGKGGVTKHKKNVSVSSKRPLTMKQLLYVTHIKRTDYRT